jgi:hypothetical protein
VRADLDSARVMYDLADMVEDKNTTNMTTQLSRENLSMGATDQGQPSTPPETSKESEKLRVVRRREKYKRKNSVDSLVRSPSTEFSTRRDGMYSLVLMPS